MMSNEVFERVFFNVTHPHLVEVDPTIVVETTQEDDTRQPTVHSELAKANILTVTESNLFRNLESHPLLLDLVLLQKYGPEWLGWELEALVARILGDFSTPSVAEVNLEKIQACKALHLVDDFWLRWEVFLHCCAAFNGSFADFHRMQIPEVAECMVAVDIANRIRDDMPWSGEVKTYLGVVHRYQSILCPQEPLEFVTVDTTDLMGDYESIQRRWPSVRKSGNPPTGATIEDEQLRRMLGCWAFLEISRNRLTAQLQVLKHV